MMSFIIILFAAVLLLYFNIRQVASGNRGALVAGASLLLAFGSFVLARGSYGFSLIQAFMIIWVCQALWMFILLDVFCFARLVARWYKKKSGQPQYKNNFVQNGARVVFIASVLLAAGLLAVGIPNHYDYKTRTLDVSVNVWDGQAVLDSAKESSLQNSMEVLDSNRVSSYAVKDRRDFKAVFFSDLHIDPLFKQEKLERLIAQCDSIQPDFILFGGDLADVHDSVLTAEGYDKLIKKLAATAKVSAVAINGNHEAYMEGSGSDPEGFLRANGWTVLDDSTACLPARYPIACFTGRRDFQKARVFEEPRKSLLELSGMPPYLAYGKRIIPWIVLDHQPKGIEEDYDKLLPDFALSGHTHDGQFFPGNILINWVWPLAYGEGVLNNVHWLVSSGVDSWGPPVRAGTDTEIWILNFKLNYQKDMEEIQ